MARAIETAEILVIGTELTTGATRDTNSGELARELTGAGVRVIRTTALPDDLDAVTAAFASGLERSDLLVSTGGLGPTPDDLTREAIAAVCGLEPHVDAGLEAWLRDLFERRGMTMPEANRKQAWLIDGAEALPNARGSAPGWWVERPDGRLIVALPGPPREMWPIWRDHALPRLRGGQLGVERASRTLRLTGAGESMLVGLIGEDVLRAANPQVATYARQDSVDIVVSAVADGGRQPAQIVDETVVMLRTRVGEYVFAEGEQGWTEALTDRLADRTVAVTETGTGGQLAALVGSAEWLVHAALERSDTDLAERAARARTEHSADVGLAVAATESRGDMRVEIAIATDAGTTRLKRTAFLAGEDGRRRAAVAALAGLWQSLAPRGKT